MPLIGESTLGYIYTCKRNIFRNEIN